MAVALAGAAPKFESLGEFGRAPDQPPTRKSVKNRDCRRRVGISRRPRRRERFTKRRRRLDRRLETLGRTLFKETQDDGFERARDIRTQDTWRHDRRVYVLRNDS